MNKFFSLTNKTILITGASSGIGKQVCIQCAAAGAKLILSGRDTERLNDVLQTIEGEGHRLLVGDLTKDDFLELTCKDLPELDGVIHSAGIMKLIPIKFIKPAILDEILDTNLRIPILLISSLVRQKKIKTSASIIMMSSINGAVIGSAANSIYGASKGGLQAFCKASSIELARNKIRINCIAPGMVETQGIDKIGKQVSLEAIELDKKKYPLGRYGNTTDIASACIFLLSDASNWITGTTMVIDGGFTAQ